MRLLVLGFCNISVLNNHADIIMPNISCKLSSWLWEYIKMSFMLNLNFLLSLEFLEVPIYARNLFSCPKYLVFWYDTCKQTFYVIFPYYIICHSNECLLNLDFRFKFGFAYIILRPHWSALLTVLALPSVSWQSIQATWHQDRNNVCVGPFSKFWMWNQLVGCSFVS